MAGAGYKLFNTGDVLTAAQVNTYLMQQTVMVFADATARTTALSGVLAEGMCSYLQDTNQMEVYDGSAWVNATGDITAVTASSPLTGGGTTGAISVGIQDGTTAQKGAVQLTDSTASTSTTTAATPNSVKTAYDLANAAVPKSTLTTKGDVLTYSTAVTRLGVGSDGTLLVAASGQTTGLQWTNSVNNINVTSSTIPANGVYLPAANTLGLATNTAIVMRIESDGRVGVGGTAGAGRSFALSSNITGSTTSRAYSAIGTIQSDVTALGSYFATSANTAAASFTITDIRHYSAIQGTFGAGSTVTNQAGFAAESSLTGATNNYGFYGGIASGTGRYNLYMAGTADNYLAGRLGLSFLNTATTLSLGQAVTGAVSGYGIYNYSNFQSDVTTNVVGYRSDLRTAASNFNISALRHIWISNATQGNVTSGGTTTNQVGLRIEDLTGATNNYAIQSNVASASNAWNLYASGTAANYFAGQTTVGSTSLTLGSSSAAQQFGVVASAATTVGAVVRGAASQTANLQEWQNSGGTNLTYISSAGIFYPDSIRQQTAAQNSFGGVPLSGVILTVKTGASGNTGLTVQGAASQSVDLQRWQDSSGTVLASVTKDAWFAIYNSTAPSSNATNGGYLYVESGALKYRGSSGTVTTIANA